MNTASTCYTIYWDDVLIGFRSYLPLPSGVIKYAARGSRLVILPDYQNLGFGTKILEFLGEYYLSKGYKYFDRSSHLRLHNHWENSPYWVATVSNGKVTGKPGPKSRINYGKRDRELNRVAYSYEYMGYDYANKKHINIIIQNTKNINYRLLENDLRLLKNKYYLNVITGNIAEKSEIENICLKLGIRTELLYQTKYDDIKNREYRLSNAHINKKSIVKYDENISNWIHENLLNTTCTNDIELVNELEKSNFDYALKLCDEIVKDKYQKVCLF